MQSPSISGRTLTFPIVGHPVAHVRAPVVFNRLFAEAGLNCACVALDLPAETVQAACRALLASPSVGGLLVTVPYKKALAGIADTLGDEARRTGAVNALRREADGRIHGDLLDGLGFVGGLRAAGCDPRGKRFLLAGAGGAGSAIASALAGAGASELRIFDSAPGLAAELAQRLAPEFPATDFHAQQTAQATGTEVVINATPLGLHAGDPLPLPVEPLAPGTLVCDIIMEPQTTPLMATAAARGLPVLGGRPMLDHQSAAYLAFFGFDEAARRVRVTEQGVTL